MPRDGARPLLLPDTPLPITLRSWSTLATKQLSALYRYTVYSWWNDVNGTLKKLGGQLLGDLWTSPIVTYIKLTWASLSALYAPPPSPPLSISIIVAEKPIYISCYQEFTFLTADKSRLVDRFFPLYKPWWLL